jgi:hypothetical protein
MGRAARFGKPVREKLLLSLLLTLLQYLHKRLLHSLNKTLPRGNAASN